MSGDQPRASTQPTRLLEVFADVVCPFAYVGLRELLQRRAALGRDDVRLVVRAWPLELVNGKAVDPHFIGEEIDEIRPQVAPDAFAGFDPTQFPHSSLPALALTAAAYDRDLATGEAVAMALRHLLFEAGRDVADPAVLAEVAARFDLPDPATLGDAAPRAEWRDGQQRGVVGSPHFFLAGESWFCPVLDISRDPAGHLHVRIDDDAAERFIAAIFS